MNSYKKDNPESSKGPHGMAKLKLSDGTGKELITGQAEPGYKAITCSLVSGAPSPQPQSEWFTGGQEAEVEGDGFIL